MAFLAHDMSPNSPTSGQCRNSGHFARETGTGAAADRITAKKAGGLESGISQQGTMFSAIRTVLAVTRAETLGFTSRATYLLGIAFAI